MPTPIAEIVSWTVKMDAAKHRTSSARRQGQLGGRVSRGLQDKAAGPTSASRLEAAVAVVAVCRRGEPSSSDAMRNTKRQWTKKRPVVNIK